MHSPVKRQHWKVSAKLSAQLIKYLEDNDLGEVSVEKVMIHLTRNDYEPDICFFSKEKSKDFKPSQMLFPAPDFVVEILSESTESRDRGIKMVDYAAHGISEYWIIDPESESVEQFTLKGDEYQLYQKLVHHRTLMSLVVKGIEVELKSFF